MDHIYITSLLPLAPQLLGLRDSTIIEGLHRLPLIALESSTVSKPESRP